MGAQHDKGKNWVDGKTVKQVGETDGSYSEQVAANLMAWDPLAGAYAKLSVDATGKLNVTGGGGGGGAVTVADGADVAQGTTTDLSSANTVVGILKAIKAAVQGTLTVATHAVTQSGVWTVARSWTLSSATDSVNVGNFPATQPVSGTVTSNIGTTNGLALDATLTGGTQKAIVRAAAKGTTAAADVTSNPVDANTQALHVDGSKVTQPVSGTFFQATQPVSLATNTPDVTDRAARLLGVVDKGKVWDGTNIAAVKAASALAVATDPAFVVQHAPQRADASTLAVTATGAAAAAVTLTLPAPAAGLFHYITSIQIVKFATALLTAAATPVLVTTTNLPGSPVFSFSAAASAQGTDEVQTITPTTPLKSSVAATATTIVGPVTTATIWRINATYYTAP